MSFQNDIFSSMKPRPDHTTHINKFSLDIMEFIKKAIKSKAQSTVLQNSFVYDGYLIIRIQSSAGSAFVNIRHDTNGKVSIKHISVTPFAEEIRQRLVQMGSLEGIVFSNYVATNYSSDDEYSAWCVKDPISSVEVRIEEKNKNHRRTFSLPLTEEWKKPTFFMNGYYRMHTNEGMICNDSRSYERSGSSSQVSNLALPFYFHASR